jgi:hypothetical protein
VKGRVKSVCSHLRAVVRGRSSSVVSIGGVQLCIGVLKLKRQFLACADTARHRVTHLGLLVFETIGQRDSGPVFFPGAGFLMGSVSDSAIPGIRIVAHRFSRSTLRVMGTKSGSIRLGQTAAKISQYVPDQRLPLFLADLFVDDRAPHAVALMYRSRPPIKTNETHAVQLGVSKISIANATLERLRSVRSSAAH